jgi:hypothetical protein
MSNSLVYTSQTAQQIPTATSYELAELRPVRNIRRPRAANFPPRLKCTAEELARATR